MMPNEDVAILCAGDTLRRFLADPPVHDAYIGVNRTVTAFPCDWWAFLDVFAFERFDPLPRDGRRPACCSMDQTIRTLREKVEAERVAGYEWLAIEYIPTTCPGWIAWKRYTMTAAVVLADHLGARSITLYGCDWSGTRDWDGVENPGGIGRSQHRWNAEAVECRMLAEWLAGHGVRLRRLTINGMEDLNAMAKNTRTKTMTPEESPVVVSGAAEPAPGEIPAPAPGSAESPAVVPVSTGRCAVRLRMSRRLGAEEIDAGHLLGMIETFEPVRSPEMLVQVMGAGHTIVKPE